MLPLGARSWSVREGAAALIRLIGFDRRPASIVEWIVNCSSTMFWQAAMLRGEAAKLQRSFTENSVAARLSGTDMPDDYHPLMPRRNPEDIDLGAIKADLEFLIERTERHRREQALNQ